MNTYLAHPDLLDQYIPDVIDIVNSQLGHGYLNETQVRTSLETGGSLFLGIAFADENADTSPPISIFYSSLPNGASGRQRGLIEFPDSVKDKPLGICIGGVFTQQRLAAYLNIGASEYPSELTGFDTIGVIRTTAVREDMQRNGIGTHLVGETMRLNEQQNVDKHLAVLWRSKTGVNLHPIVTKFGLKPVQEYKNYWFKESQQKGYSCTKCGAPPCKCTGILYIGRTGQF